MAEAEWYYAIGGQQHGPVSVAQLRELVASGQITPRDLVWRDGMADWMPIGSALGAAPAQPPFAKPVAPDISVAPLRPAAEPKGTAQVKWYYALAGQQHGPVPAEQIQQLLASGQLTSQDLVWRDGMAIWRPIVSVPEFGVAPAVAAIAQPLYPGYAGHSSQLSYATPKAYGQIEYAGFWLRFVAAILDGLILLAINIPLACVAGALVISSGGLSPTASLGLRTVVRVLQILIAWLYFVSQECGPNQATPGKRTLGLVVTDLQGERISFGRATGRYFGKFISELTLCIGFIMAGFTPRKQALHDMIAGCLVMRKPTWTPAYPRY